MQTYENQKVVTTRSAKHDKKHIYGMFNVDAMEEAMALLKANTFKVWCYIAKNQDNHTFALSCVDTCRFCKMSKPTYLGCIQELIDTGYLVNTSGNQYDFFEKLPDDKDEIIEVTVRKEPGEGNFNF